MLGVIHWDADPQIFSCDGIPILEHLSYRWYGLLFMSSFVFGHIIIQKIFKKEGIKDRTLSRLVNYMFFSTFIGARLGHVLFYQFDHYIQHPIEILKVWEGGLASHGAAIGILIGLYLFTRKSGKTFIWILDRIVIVVALAAVLIRTGNLMNSEIYGDITSLPWGFIFVRNSGINGPAHHPTQIYEALCYLITFGILYSYYWKHKGVIIPGTLFSIFLIGIFGTRFFIEFIKEPQVAFETSMILNMGQWLSIPFVLGGIIILLHNRKKEPIACWA